jgi:CheY-like chemotaxis protein
VKAEPHEVTNILLAEDCDDDAFFLSYAFARLEHRYVLHRVRDGAEAIACLNDQPGPDVLLLDLKMPRVDGFEVLAYMRAKVGVIFPPAIVLSGSDLAQDKAKARELGATEYFVKSSDYDALALALDQRISRLVGT